MSVDILIVADFFVFKYMLMLITKVIFAFLMLTSDWILEVEFSTLDYFVNRRLATSKVTEYSNEKQMVKRDMGNLSQKVGDKTRSCWIDVARVHNCLNWRRYIVQLHIPVL